MLAASPRSQRDVNFCLCLELSAHPFTSWEPGHWWKTAVRPPGQHTECHCRQGAARDSQRSPSHPCRGPWPRHSAVQSTVGRAMARGISPCCSSELDTGRSPLACRVWGLSSIMPREVLLVGAQCWPSSCYWTRSSGPCCSPPGSQLIRDKRW